MILGYRRIEHLIRELCMDWQVVLELREQTPPNLPGIFRGVLDPVDCLLCPFVVFVKAVVDGHLPFPCGDSKDSDNVGCRSMVPPQEPVEAPQIGRASCRERGCKYG